MKAATYALLLLTAYLVGSIPFSLIFGKLFKGLDVRKVGSGNVGATNTLITAGKRAGILAVTFDVAKGVSIFFLAELLTKNELMILLASILVVLGHVFPIYLNFKGGKGLATMTGVFIAINPYVIWVILSLYFLFLIITRYLILSSLLVLALLPFIFLFLNDGPYAFFFALSVFVIALYAHRRDLEKLISGQEKKLFDVI